MATKINSGQIKQGEHLSASTEFTAGQKAWNKGKSHLQKELHPNWRGGKPNCLDCGKKLSSYLGKRCSPCHLISPSHRANLNKAHESLTGKPGARLGKKHSEKTKRQISEKKTGVSAVWNIGKGHVAWNKIGDGITSQSKLERAKFNKAVQPLVLARDNYTCQICNQYSGNLQVDHIKRWSEYPELRFDLDNCRTLCMACHYYITFKRKLPQGVVWGHNLSKRTT